MIDINPSQFLNCQHDKGMFWCSIKDRETGKPSESFTTDILLIDDVAVEQKSFNLASSTSMTCKGFGIGRAELPNGFNVMGCKKTLV